MDGRYFWTAVTVITTALIVTIGWYNVTELGHEERMAAAGLQQCARHDHIIEPLWQKVCAQ